MSHYDKRQTDLNIAFARKDWNMDNQPDARQVEEPLEVTALRCQQISQGDIEILNYIDALLAANRELAKEVEAHKTEHDISDGLLKDAETRALAALKDAERYRWLRDKADRDDAGHPYIALDSWLDDSDNEDDIDDFHIAWLQGEEADAAIDAAAK